MEPSEHGLLEEFLALRRDTCSTFSSAVNEFFPNGWSFDAFDENPVLSTSNPSFEGFSNPSDIFECPFTQVYPSVDGFTIAAEIDSSYNNNNNNGGTPPFPLQEEYPSLVEDEDISLLNSTDLHALEEERTTSCKVEMEPAIDAPVFNLGFCGERKTRVKKLEGQPSKNLMAERRRRKRLNDRLSMLRSIVPKISKMDRTSILGDTIDYMKELLEKINKLREEEMEVGSDQTNLMGIFKELKQNEVIVRNSPKFDVERRNMDTRIEICCAAKPGLLLSTVNTLELLGLEIQQCVISCFNDFSMQASCSEVVEQEAVTSSEDVKQALFRNAGYGGRCL